MPAQVLCGLWGVNFLQKSWHLKESTATTGTSVTTAVAGVSMLLSGSFATRVRADEHKQWRAMFCLAVVGGLASALLSAGGLLAGSGGGRSTFLAFTGLCCIGLSQGGISIAWGVADRHNAHTQHHALLNGIINTTSIGMDAVTSLLFGTFLDLNWGGAVDEDGSRVYSARAYSSAFLMMPALYALSCVVCVKDMRVGLSCSRASSSSSPFLPEPGQPRESSSSMSC